jgi:O-antigen ligase
MSIAVILDRWRLALTLEKACWLLAVLALLGQPLPGGPRLPVWIAAFLGLGLLARKSVLIPFRPMRRMLIILACLIIPVFLSLPGSAAPGATLKILLVLLVFIPVSAVYLIGLCGSGAQHRTLVWVNWTMALWAADMILQWMTGFDILGYPALLNGYITGPFDPGHLRAGTFMAFMAALPAWCWGMRRPWMALTLTLLLAATCGLNGQRTALWASCLAVVFAFPALAGRFRAGLLVVPVLAALFFAASPVGGHRLEQTVGSPAALSSASVFDKFDQKLSGRMSIWRTAWLEFSANPILGVGAGAFREAYLDYAPSNDRWRRDLATRGLPNHVHHTWLALATECGLAGVLSLMLAVTFCLRWFRSAPADARKMAAPWASVLCVYLFPVASHAPFFLMWWFPFIWLITCAMVAALEGCSPRAD